VWSPSAIGLVDKLESVQRRFTKKITGLSSLSYNERCELLNIDKLELRRLRIDLIMCYKIIHGLVALTSDDFFTLSDYHSTRGHSFKLVVPESRVNCRSHFFAVRVIRIWNNLPEEIVSVTHLSAFTAKLKKYNLNAFLIGTS
jgi:hypothetical protein